MNVEFLLNNVHIATMDTCNSQPYGTIKNGAAAINDGHIVWIGESRRMPAINATHTLDGKSMWLTPGLIDCHTHIVYGGNRSQEFEARLKGSSYEEISRQGGGINSTVKHTQACSENQLFELASHRSRKLLAEGVTTIESKSGYGQDLDNELKMLRVNRRLKESGPMNIVSTFLGLHAIPLQYQNNSDHYVNLVCEQMLPAVVEQDLADAVDVFCENIAFSTSQCEMLFKRCSDFQIPVKGHVEQLSYQQGAKLVAKYGGLSVDHIEYLPDADIPLLKKRNVTAVVLPTPFYYLNEKQQPPIAALRQEGVAIAIASDHNPGSSPSLSLLTAMNQACVLFRFTPEESLQGTTVNAAKALGLCQSKGQLKKGFDADMVLWDIQHPSELSYGINMNHPHSVWIGGEHVHTC